MKTRKLIPMLFSTEMARANMEGRKTETRRIIKKQPPEGCVFIGATDYHNTDSRIKRGYYWCDGTSGNMQGFWPANDQSLFCPYGQIGDVLWMRETFCFINKYHYAASVCSPRYDKPDSGWKPGIHMPLEACRFFAEIIEIRVERLHEITQSDALAEGIKVIEEDEAYYDYMQTGGSYANARGSYTSLWIKINGDQSWSDNPWVWVVKYLRLSDRDILNMLPEIVYGRKPGSDAKKVYDALLAKCQFNPDGNYFGIQLEMYLNGEVHNAT